MRTGTKFWLAVAVVGVQILMFAALLFTGKFTEGMVPIFLGAPTATFTAFGVMNLWASGQTPPPSNPSATGS